jgi:transketolase
MIKDCLFRITFSGPLNPAIIRRFCPNPIDDTRGGDHSTELQQEIIMAKATRQAFGEALAEVGENNPNVVAFDADLAKSTMSVLFAKKFPERFYEMGIQEANMIGAAAGMALSGKIPFICSFACFITGRYDTIRMSVAYSRAGVKIVGTHAGIGIGEDEQPDGFGGCRSHARASQHDGPSTGG